MQRKPKCPATKKSIYILHGGPYAGKQIPLTTPSTIVFEVDGMKGRYRPASMVYPSNRVRLSGGEPTLKPVDYEGFMGDDLIWENHDG